MEEYLKLQEEDLLQEMCFGEEAPPQRQAFLIALLIHCLLISTLMVFGFGTPPLNYVLKQPTVSAQYPSIHLKFYYSGGSSQGGGGGGGGQRDSRRAPVAQLKGPSVTEAPIHETPKPAESEKQPDPTPLDQPALHIPTTVTGGEEDRPGVMPFESTSSSDGQVETGGGSGSGGGIGTGTGIGIGSGTGNGIGPGSGGGSGGGPYRPGGGVSMPKLIHEEKVVFPDEAKRHFVAGIVILEAVVKADGSVGDIRLIRPLPDGCVEASINALRKWKFLPGRKNGVPVDVFFMVTFTFS